MTAKLSKIVNLYVLLMLVVFPLFMVHSYYDIQTVKMYLYQFSTIGCLALVIIAGTWLYTAEDKSERAVRAVRFNIGSLRKVLTPADVFALLFVLVSELSTFTSEWVYEAFWGNVGRFQGGYMILLFFVSYVLVSRLYVPGKWHIDACIAGGLIVCGWGVLDYFSLSPIGFNANRTFSSTIGNIDVLTAIEAMYLSLASFMFVAEKPDSIAGKRRSIYYLAAMFICFMGLECGRAANQLLSLAFIICFLPFYAFGSGRGILRYVMMLTVYVLAMLTVALLAHAFPDMVIEEWFMGELDGMANNHIRELAVLAAILILFTMLLRTVFVKKDMLGDIPQPAKRLRIIWAALGVITLCILIYIFYDANTGGHPELYAPLRNLIIFDDSWGTNRGYAWKLAFKYYEDFPFIKKLIGSGPETFGIYVTKYDLNATLSIYDMTYDSIHNEWLQRAFECGILGFIGFYGMAAAACVNGFKNGRHTGAFAFAVLVYIVQSFVNICVPLVLPFTIICMAIAAAVSRIEYNAPGET